MIDVRYHDSVNVLQELFAQDAKVRAASPFDRAEWYALLEETGLSPLIADASDGNTQAALPLMREAGQVVPLRNWYSFTWRPFVPEGPEGDALLAEIARRLRAKTHRVTLEPVPEEDGSARRLAEAFRKAGWRVEVTRCDTNHVQYVNRRSFDDYWATRPGPLRTTFKRKAKKVDVVIHERFDAEAWAQYEGIYAASWKPEEGKPEMLRAFAQAEGEAGRLRLGLAFHDGQAIAAQFWTVENGTAYIHKLAHLEKYRNLSAGTTLSVALFERTIDQDMVALVDFGTGTQPYKSDWMDDIRYRYRIDCLDMKSPRAWLDLAKLAWSRTISDEWLKLAPGPMPS